MTQHRKAKSIAVAATELCCGTLMFLMFALFLFGPQVAVVVELVGRLLFGPPG